jgi:hypothetical protein
MAAGPAPSDLKTRTAPLCKRSGSCQVVADREPGEDSMSDDKNKSYRDGLYNQPYSGRNWDQWVAGNNARGTGQNNYYSGPKPSSIQWPSTEEEDEDDKGGKGGGGGFLLLILLPVAVVGIGIIAASAVLSLVAAPLLKLAERLTGATERKSFGAAYLTSLKALSAYGIVAVAAGLLLHLLMQYIFPFGILGYIAFCINTVAYGIYYGAPIPLGAFIGANIFLAPPALAAFAYVLRRDYRTAYSGGSGFLRGMIVGIPLAGISLALATLVYALVMF